MTKKILNSLMILLLVLLTSGFSVSRHLCGDHLVSVSVNETAKSCCGEQSTCCDNDTILIQLRDHFITVTTCETPRQPNATDKTGDIIMPAAQKEMHSLSIYLINDHQNLPANTTQGLALLQTYLL